MSGAEAIVVLGVISSVIAIIDGTKQIYDAAADTSGLPEAFREVVKRLPVVRTIVSSAEQYIRDGQVDEGACKALKPLILACEEKAKKLDTIFQQVLPAEGASRMDRYFKAARTLGKGGRVETLMKGMLDDVLLLASNHEMRSATAHQVEEVKQAIESISKVEVSVPDSEFQEITFVNNNYGGGSMTNNNVQGNQKYQANYGTGRQFQAESQVFNMENERVEEQIFHAQVQNFIASPPALKDEDVRRACEHAVLKMLEFSGMKERYEGISEAEKQTFGWIYDHPSLKFVDWLQSGAGIYWITGKAGSGKSTLMKFLFEDSRTLAALPQNTSTVGFFFHERGDNRLLKSQEGLFRAVMYSILSNYRQLISSALPQCWKMVHDDIVAGREHERVMGWSSTELKNGFKTVVSQRQLPLHLCLLIDGLDEFSGEHQEIVNVLADLLPPDNSPVRVQLCLSSRPLNVFDKAYLKYPHLRVQDLTARDIQICVTTTFNKVPELKQLQAKDPTTTSQIMDEILLKAEGVFLWVTLVVRSLVESLENDDDMKTLQMRLSALPAGLEPLYKRMIEDIKPFYQEQAAQLFSIVQYAVKPLSPLAMYYFNVEPKESLVAESFLTDIQIEERHSTIAKRLKARTVGLVEISPLTWADEGLAEDLDSGHALQNTLPWQAGKVQYLHLTVKEFFRTENVPSWLIAKMSSTSSDIHLKIAACCLRQLHCTGSYKLYDYRKTNRFPPPEDLPVHEDFCKASFEGILYMIVFHSLQVERLLKASQLEYLAAMDSFIMSHDTPAFLKGKGIDLEFWQNRGPWHWTLERYGDWSEPDGWHSDFMSYLITIGMTRSVISLLQNGYNPCLKRGRSSLLYATCNLAPDYSIGDMERDTIDPLIVEELLKRKCNPNQYFNSLNAHDARDKGNRTVWQAVLLHVYQRFVLVWPHTEDAARYEVALQKDQKAMHNLRVRWLKTFKLFLDYGADLNTIVVQYKYQYVRQRGIRTFVTSRISCLSIFNKVFGTFDDPLVGSLREFMVSQRAKEVEEDIPDTGAWESDTATQHTASTKSESRLRHIPVVGQVLSKWRTNKHDKDKERFGFPKC